MRWSQPVWTRFLPTRTVLATATLGPVGRRLPAPGTWGSVAGLLYFVVVFEPFGNAVTLRRDLIGNILLSALGAYVAVAFCGEAEFRLGRKDPGEVILDEFVAMPLCFLGWPSLLGPLSMFGQFRPLALSLIGLGLFRLFDIAKPFGISRIQNLPGGWGIVLDDTAAALAACATMHAARAVWLYAQAH
jgi:phosphatidylglycerophosphatase A